MTIITRYELELDVGETDCESCGSSWDFISVASYGKVGDPGFDFYGYESLGCHYHDGPDGDTPEDLKKWLCDLAWKYPNHTDEIYAYRVLVGL